MKTAIRSSLFLSLCLLVWPALAATNLIQSNITSSATVPLDAKLLGTLASGQTRQFPVSALQNALTNFPSISATQLVISGSVIGLGTGLTNATGYAYAGQDDLAASVAAVAAHGISVKSAPYNAVGDGVTDDTAAIQACLDANTNVFIPEGRFLSGKLYVPLEGTTITGIRGQSWLLYSTAETSGAFLNFTNKSGTLLSVSIDGQASTNDQFSGTIYQYIPNSDKKGTSAGRRTAVSFRSEGYGLLWRNTILNFEGYGIAAWGDTDMDARLNHALIEANYITNCWTGIALTNNNGSEYVTVVRNNVNHSQTGIEVNSANVIVSENDLIDTRFGLYSKPGNRRGHWNFTKNKLHHSGYGIYLEDADNWNIGGNTILACALLIVTNCNGGLFQGNYVESTIGLREWNSGAGRTNAYQFNMLSANTGTVGTPGFENSGVLVTNSLWTGNSQVGVGLVMPWAFDADTNRSYTVNVNPQSSSGRSLVLSGDLTIGGTVTATNGYVLPTLGANIPTNSILPSSAGGTNWTLCVIGGLPRLIATNYSAAGKFLKCVGETVSDWP